MLRGVTEVYVLVSAENVKTKGTFIIHEAGKGNVMETKEEVSGHSRKGLEGIASFKEEEGLLV